MHRQLIAYFSFLLDHTVAIMGRLCVIIYIYLYVHMFVFISCVHMHWFMFASVFFWFGHTVTIVGSPSVVFICTHKVWCLYVHIYVYMHICIHL